MASLWLRIICASEASLPFACSPKVDQPLGVEAGVCVALQSAGVERQVDQESIEYLQSEGAGGLGIRTQRGAGDFSQMRPIFFREIRRLVRPVCLQKLPPIAHRLASCGRFGQILSNFRCCSGGRYAGRGIFFPQAGYRVRNKRGGNKISGPFFLASHDEPAHLHETIQSILEGSARHALLQHGGDFFNADTFGAGSHCRLDLPRLSLRYGPQLCSLPYLPIYTHKSNVRIWKYCTQLRKFGEFVYTHPFINHYSCAKMVAHSCAISWTLAQNKFSCASSKILF